MADHEWSGLPYGHFGNVTYQPEEQSWRFERVADQPRILESLGHPHIVIPATDSCDLTTAGNATKEPPKLRYDKQIKDFTRSFPEFQSASPLLRPLLQTSEAVESAANRHDPMKGDLLSFGRVFDEQTRRSTQIAAFATGPTGSDVRVVQVQLQKQGWDDSKDVWLEVPVVLGEETTWRGQGPPVQQVCFAQPIESGENLLAIRTVSNTKIYKPVMRKAGPSRLHLRLLFEVPTHVGQRNPPADVVFNTWFPRQFAMIDQSASWTVWEFRSRESSDATCIRSDVVEEDPDHETKINDGWARLVWVCNPSTVMVATRRSVTLHDISSGSTQLQKLEVNVSELAGWVLDLVTVPSDPTRALVLTTTHLHLISVEDRNGEVRARCATRIRHYRSPEDITLRLALFRDEEGWCLPMIDILTSANIYQAITIIVRSALNSTIVAYRFDLGTDRTTILHDPMEFRLEAAPCSATHANWNLEFHFQPIAIAEKRSASVDHTIAGRLRSEDCHLFSMMTFTQNRSMTSLLFSDRPSNSRLPRITSPTWHGKLLGTSSKIKTNFVVEDDEMAVMDMEFRAVPPVPNYLKHRMQSSGFFSGLHWTMDHALSAVWVEQGATHVESLDDRLLQLRGWLAQASDPEYLPMKTALELSDEELTMDDMELASTKLQELNQMENSQYAPLPDEAEAGESRLKLVLRPMPAVSSLSGLPPGSASAEAFTLAYDEIVSNWISPLPKVVSGRIRLAKEQLARRLAAEITLASHVFHVEDVVEEPTETQQDAKPASQYQSWDLPMREADYSQPSQVASQSVLPTPSPTGTPSVTTNSTRTSAFSSAEVARLRKYTTFTKPAPSSSRSVNKVLSHWTLGTDPENYDWLSTSRQINRQTEEEEAESQLTEKERARLHRKAERHIRRQRKEAAASQQQHLASSQMPELVVSASQPPARAGAGAAAVKSESQAMGRPGAGAAPVGGMFGSSQSVAMPGAASQAVAGRYGGRPPAKKKKRKQGF